MNAPDTKLIRLIDQSPSLEVLVLRCVIAESQRVADIPLIRGVGQASFAELCRQCMADLVIENGEPAGTRFDEFEELFELLLDYAAPLDQMAIWLAAAIATAAQRDNHLWQDMGLPSRRELNAILRQRFPSLAALNVGDMKWKKFFYRQLCQRAGVPICKSPSCGDCVDHALCFGEER